MTILYERILKFASESLNLSNRISTRTAFSGQLKPCSTVTEMVTRLTILNWPSDRKLVLLIDEVDRLIQLDSNSFSVLLRLPEILDNKISLVLASREHFDDFGPSITTGLVPIKITLKSFSYFETREIITEQLKNENFPLKDVENSIKIVQQVANSTVKELSVLRNLTASILSAGKTVPTSKLPKLVQERIDASNRLDSFYKQTIFSLNLIEKNLLISAFIASFQTAREDSKTFGSTLLTFKKQTKKDKITSNSDKLTIKLPKLFDQTRLIAIFYFIIEGLTILPSPQQLQLNIKSLCDRGLLKVSGNSSIKIDSIKYRVNISRDFATNIANDLEIELDKYIST
jgi:hypothetical protein